MLCALQGSKRDSFLGLSSQRALKPRGMRNGTMVQRHGSFLHHIPTRQGFSSLLSQNLASLLVDKYSCCQKSIWSSDLPSISLADESDKWILAMNFNFIKQWILITELEGQQQCLRIHWVRNRLLLGHI